MKKDLKNIKFNLSCLGGTFDLFHKGHRDFLDCVLEKSDRLVIGVVSDRFAKERFKNNIQSFAQRRKSVKDYLNQKKAEERAEIIKIDNIFGPTLSKDYAFNTIFATEDTKQNAWKINKKRKEKGLREFKIVVVPKTLSLDNFPISSSRIREGRINEEGNIISSLILPEDLREQLREPFGDLIDPNEISKQIDGQIITVGDVITKTFLDLKIKPLISVVDFLVRREQKFNNLKEIGFSEDEFVINVRNKAGTINFAIWEKISKVFKEIKNKKNVVILVEGEEDLCVLPLIILSPLYFTIYYGQPARQALLGVAGGPEKGIVKIKVDKKSKKKALKILSKFERKVP